METLTFIVDVQCEGYPTEAEVTAAQDRLRTYVNGVVLAGLETAGATDPAKTEVEGHHHGDNHPNLNLCKDCTDHGNFGHF